MTRFRPWPTLIQICSVLCAKLQLMPRATGSSPASIVAGVPDTSVMGALAYLGRGAGALASGWKSPTVARGGAGPTTTASQAGASSSGGDTPLAQGLAYAQCMR